jgi:hypothetical protein
MPGKISKDNLVNERVELEDGTWKLLGDCTAEELKRSAREGQRRAQLAQVDAQMHELAIHLIQRTGTANLGEAIEVVDVAELTEFTTQMNDLAARLMEGTRTTNVDEAMEVIDSWSKG